MIRTLNVGMRRGDSPGLLWRAIIRLWNLIAIRIHNAGAGLISGFKLDLSLERLDLLFVQEVAKLVTIFDALFTRQNLVPRWRWCARDAGSGGFRRIGASNGDLSMLLALSRRGRRRTGRYWSLLNCSQSQRGICVVLWHRIISQQVPG